MTGRATGGRRARGRPDPAPRASAGRRGGPARSHADPGRRFPGSASRSDTSSARRRSGASMGATSSKTGARRSESPVNDSNASASTLRCKQDAAEPLLGLLDTGLPQDRLADPRLAGEDERGRSTLDTREERLDRAELRFAADYRRHGPRAILAHQASGYESSGETGTATAATIRSNGTPARTFASATAFSEAPSNWQKQASSPGTIVEPRYRTACLRRGAPAPPGPAFRAGGRAGAGRGPGGTARRRRPRIEATVEPHRGKPRRP